MSRRSSFASALAYTTLTVLVASPAALAATDLNTVIDNLKLWLTGLPRLARDRVPDHGGCPLRDGRR